MNTIHLTPNHEQKYIVALVETAGGEEVLLWGDPAAEWHNDIVENVKEKRYMVQNVLGGGKIQVLTDQKLIYVWGVSSRFGKVDVDQVRSILTEHFAGYEILNKEPEV